MKNDTNIEMKSKGRGKIWGSGEGEGKTLHTLPVLGVNDDLWDRVSGFVLWDRVRAINFNLV